MPGSERSRPADRGPRRALLAVVAAAALAAGFAEEASSFRLTSPAFAPGAASPAQFTCRGANKQPALRWTAPPARTRSFALTMHDPDAPIACGFSHWVARGLPVAAGGLAQGKPAPVSGANGTGARGYPGACPPSGVHHYRFVLYALDAPLKLAAGAGCSEVLQAIKEHVVARAELVGIFPGP